jgi:methionine synthase I (cobalamin-dependent)
MSASNPLADLLSEKGVLLADGATGTNLFAMGLESGEAPELWLETAPEKITKLHQDFVDAGSDIILTNSFGGTRNRLKLHHADDRVFELNKKAARSPAPSPTRPRARSSSPALSARPVICWCLWVP